MKLLQKAGRLFTAVVMLFQMSSLSTIVSSSTARATSNVVPAGCIEVTDVQGANDEPGQKDLTLMCSDGSELPTSISVSWQWDETTWTGNNSGDACALFDKPDKDDKLDGKIDFAFCVVIGGSPASQLSGSPVVYSCGNDKADRCTNKTLVNKSYLSTCQVVSGTDPFVGGAGYPTDTRANCTIRLSDFSTPAPTSAKLVDVCSYPSQQPNSDPSDCIIADSSETTTVELKKEISPDTDTGKFNLFVNKSQLVTDGGDGSTTGQIIIKDDENLTLKETQGTSTLMSNYTTTLACVDQQGKIVSTSTISSTTTENTATVSKDSIKEGDNLVCTFTNTRKNGKVKVVKDVINDNGGKKKATDFTFTNNLGAAQTFVLGQNGEDGDRTLDLPLGSTFSIKEVQENSNGYTTTYSGCSGTVGETLQTCTITNNDQVGSLTVKKVVINDDDGNNTASSFSFKKSGDQTVYSFVNSQNNFYEGSKTLSVNAGTYSVTEEYAQGYSVASNTCKDIVVPNGGSAECTITNDDIAPTVTIIKHVTNDDGGTLGANDFGITLRGNPVVFGDGVADSSTQKTYTKTVTIASNSAHTVAEADTDGYKEGYWGCTVNGSPIKGATFTPNEGDEITCQVTNDDEPAFLIVIKDILGNYGGTESPDDFALYYGETKIENNTPTKVAPGTYSITEKMTEKQAKGYRYVSTVCGPTSNYEDEEDEEEDFDRMTMVKTDEISAQVKLGQSITCTITNEEIAPKLTLVKDVITDDGGTATETDWTLYATPETKHDEEDEEDSKMAVYPTLEGKGGFESKDAIANITYILSESNGPAGYEASDWDCGDNANLVGNKLTLALGDDVTCTITNDDIAPRVHVAKFIDGDVCNTYGFKATYEQGREDEEPTTYGFSLVGSEGCESESETNQTESFDVYAGPVTIAEETSDDWMTRAFCMTGETLIAETEGFGSELSFDAELDTDTYCYFYNTEKATVKITKYEDKNKNGEMDDDEQALSGWDLQAILAPLGDGEVTPTTLEATTGEDGSVTFDVLKEFDGDLRRLTLNVSETQKDGWVLSNITCTVKNPVTFDQEKVVSDEILPTLLDSQEEQTTIQPGSVAECFIGNTKKPIVEVLSDTITPPLSDTGASTAPLMIAGTALLLSLALAIRRREEN